jgi:hypothetical protein
MSSHRATYILAAILMLAAIAAAAGFVQMSRQRSLAQAQQRDLADSLRLLGDLSDSSKSPGRIPATRLDGADLNRRIREAATTAAISERLASIEPNRPVRLGESDYNELMVFLRFDNVKLREVASFMHRLSAIDPACRIKTIELESPPDSADNQNWTSDITLAYLTYAPRESTKGESQ